MSQTDQEQSLQSATIGFHLRRGELREESPITRGQARCNSERTGYSANRLLMLS